MQTEDQKILDNQLFECIKKGEIPKIEMLLLLGADMNSFNDKGMTAVSSVRDVETLKFLIEKGHNQLSTFYVFFILSNLALYCI